MAWVAVDKDGEEVVFGEKPKREFTLYLMWIPCTIKAGNGCELPKGSIKKLIGHELTWDDEPVEL